jgi:protease I
MPDIASAKIAILATDGFEQSELMTPLFKLRDAGATVEVVAPAETKEPDFIHGWAHGEWGDRAPIDKRVADVSVDDYDALVLPGGQINPDKLRMDAAAVDLIRAFVKSGKPVAAICHAPWLLIEAEAVKGRKITSWPSLKTDLRNAGANWVDAEVVTDQGLITSRNPDDLEAFVAKIIEEVGEGRHTGRKAS